MFFLFPLLVLLATVLADTPTIWFQAEDPMPKGGFKKWSADFNFDPNSKHERGYYAAAQCWMENGEAHYFGLQPGDTNNGGKNHVTYLIFGANTSVADANRCLDGADYGAGVSCGFDYPWEFGKWYTIELELVNELPDGRHQWNGTLIEPNGNRVYIALFYTTPAVGGINGAASQWLEYFKFNVAGQTPETRECQHYGKVNYHYPRFGDSSSSKITELVRKMSLYDKCALAAGEPNTRGGKTSDGIYFEGGFLPQV